ncbi:MAG: hypothetical protein AAF618_00640 [Pseudomonadota bacterium]
MCLTTTALAMFLNLVGSPHISQEPGRIIVHAETRDAHWVMQPSAADDVWCTMAPQIDRMARFSEAAAE